MPSTGEIETPSPTTAPTAANEDEPDMDCERGLVKDFREPRPGDISLKKAATASLGLHLLTPPALLIVALLVAWMMHWDFWFWLKPQPKQDLTFTLVLDTHAKRPEKPLHKSVFNQKAGGKQKAQTPPKPKVSEPPPKTVAQSTPTPEPPKPQQAVAEKPVPHQPAVKPQQSVAVKKPAAVAASTPSNTSAQPMQTASTTPSPSDAVSNPQNGPAPVNGVDVAQDVDFGPFMADLEKRIKHNWVPPRGSESRKVRLMLYLQRDGQLAKVEISISSGDQIADQAAVSAAEQSAPFMALPPQIKEDVLPVEFTFDYNVLNSHKREQL